MIMTDSLGVAEQIAALLFDNIAAAWPSMNPTPHGPRLPAEQLSAPMFRMRARYLAEIADSIEADPSALPLVLRRLSRMLEKLAGDVRVAESAVEIAEGVRLRLVEQAQADPLRLGQRALGAAQVREELRARLGVELPKREENA